MQPPAAPACRASATAGKTGSSSGSNSQVDAVEKSQAAATAGTRSGQPSASAMGSFMSGGLACAIVEPSVNVTIECTIDCGYTTMSMRPYGMPNSRWASMSSSPLLTSDAEFKVFIGPIDQVGCAPACSGVTCSRSAAEQPREGPPGGSQHQLGDLVRASAAQALRQRGVFGVNRHDLAGLGGGQHQRATGDQRFLVRQGKPGPGGQRGQRRLQGQR